MCLATLLPRTVAGGPRGPMTGHCTAHMLFCMFYFIFLGHKYQRDDPLKYLFGHSFGMCS